MNRKLSSHKRFQNRVSQYTFHCQSSTSPSKGVLSFPKAANYLPDEKTGSKSLRRMGCKLNFHTLKMEAIKSNSDSGVLVTQKRNL